VEWMDMDTCLRITYRRTSGMEKRVGD